jgi:hypothetical protein
MDCTTRAATPRSGSTDEALGVTKVGIGLTIGSAGFIVVTELLIGSKIFSIIGRETSALGCGVTTGAGSTRFADCDLGIGGTPGFDEPEFVEVFNDGVPLKSAKKSHQALSTDAGST